MRDSPPMPSQPDERQLRQRIADCLLQASRVYRRPFPQPSLQLNQRGKAAGSARLREWCIRLNPLLLADNPRAFWEEVIPHEVAHLVVHALWGRTAPHGPEWRQVMTDVFGLPPRVTHRLDVSKVQGPTFAYRCACQQHTLSLRRHNRCQRDQVRYLCTRCGQPLVPLPPVAG